MRYNSYQANTYSRRSPIRGLARNQPPQKPKLSKRLIEEFVTQFTICALVTGVIFGAQLLRLPNMNDSISKMKTLLTYSPSLKEMALEAKEGTRALMEKISSGDQQPNNLERSTEELPIILVDDDIF